MTNYRTTRQYPHFSIAAPTDAGESDEQGATGPVVFCSKTIGNLPEVSVRPTDVSLLDMAEAMLELGAVAPRLKSTEGDTDAAGAEL